MRFSPEKYEEVKRMRLILFSLSPLSSILFPQSHRYSFHANTAVLQLITHNLELCLLKLLFFSSCDDHTSQDQISRVPTNN